MTQDQIMALIDTFAEAETSFWFGLDEVGTKFDTDARRNRDDARAAVAAALEALTKDAERYLFLRDNFAVNSSDDRFEFAELAQLNGTGFDHKIDQEMKMYNATTGKPST